MFSKFTHLHIYTFACWVILSLALVACTPSSSPTVRKGNRYATGFELQQQADSSYVLTIYSPWQPNSVMGQYTIAQPYQRICSNACTHVGYIKELDAMEELVGITDRHLVYSPLADSVADLGNSMSPNREQLVLLQPDMILLSTYAEGDATPEQLRQLGLPIVYINEWQETHPLARAEWIRVFGVLTGRLNRADSIFQQVCAKYHQLTDSPINRLTDSPTILSGQDFRGTWYVPAGGTYMGQLYKDAGYSYRYAEDARTQSIPLTTEQVIRDFQDANVWVGVQANSLNELAQTDSKHTWFKAYEQGRVYSFLKRTTASGGNDFWETGVVHPELILQDLRLIQTHAESDSLYFTMRLR